MAPVLPLPVLAHSRYFRWHKARVRELYLERLGTGERVQAPFCVDGKHVYVPGYDALCTLMRDEHVAFADGARMIAPRLLEAMWEVQDYLRWLGVTDPLVVHSGYRTPWTNAHTEGAARNSLHMYGMAVDFHVPSVPIDFLWKASSVCPNGGGAGYYPEGWVHLDSGWRRYWSG